MVPRSGSNVGVPSNYEKLEQNAEHVALRKVRSLVDDLEDEQASARRNQKRALIIFFVVVGLFALWVATGQKNLRAMISRSPDTQTEFVSVRTTSVSFEMEPRFGNYVETCIKKIEQIANSNYPPNLRGTNGRIKLTVVIRANGSLEKVAVDKSSGDAVLDAAAIGLVKAAQPFAAFPDDLRRDTDALQVTKEFRFAKEGTFSAETPLWKFRAPRKQ
jgi:TonB family protein